jgi:hypothetical protein
MYSKRYDGGKTCSVCGTWHEDAHYSYNRKDDRSYCQPCNKLISAAESEGGSEAATKLRQELRLENVVKRA